MLNLLLKSALIVDPGASLPGSRKDILIEAGKIKKIDRSISAEGVEEFDASALCVSPGWFDMRANFRDPGQEYKEDLYSGSLSAIAGGFTGVAVMPSTQPPIHTKSGVEYIKNKSASLLVDIFPVGTISHEHEGKELSEMYDMFQSGAVAFSDDKKPIANAGLLLRALLYARNFNALIISYPEDKSISSKGLMNEGINSIRLGMKGSPSLAEELMVARDISLAEYAGTGLHFSNISTAGSVDIIRKAKARGIKISADVNAHHLFLDDSFLGGYDSNYKVKPPLRAGSDIEALKKGLQDGTLDAICTDHSPEDIESKNVEFEYAASGIIGLESAFGILHTCLKDLLSLEEIVAKITLNPRKLLSIPIPTIAEGVDANLTLFDPQAEWTFTRTSIRSKSQNTPFIGTPFTGKAVAVINNNQFSLC